MESRMEKRPRTAAEHLMAVTPPADSAPQPGLTVGQLEGGYLAYCKALRMLIAEGRTLNQIKRTVCWDRLSLLYEAMPRQYRNPELHYGMLKRQIQAAAAAPSA
jgi:hypothetical protein